MGKAKKPVAKKIAEAKPTGNVADVRQFMEALEKKKSMLITLRDELYEGDWESMLEDLQSRLDGKPYIFKLVNRIEEDMVWCRELREAELRFGVNLAKFLKSESEKRPRRP